MIIKVFDFKGDIIETFYKVSNFKCRRDCDFIQLDIYCFVNNELTINTIYEDYLRIEVLHGNSL